VRRLPQGHTLPSVDDVFDRVEAMPAVTQLWPEEPGAGSGFAADATTASVSTYAAARVLTLGAVRQLQAAARIARNSDLAKLGTHILLLRPALISTAKAAWLVETFDSAERISRAARLVAQDRNQGAIAMRKAVEQGAPTAFGAAGEAFGRTRHAVLSAVDGFAPDANERPPSEERLIRALGAEIDRYYGTDTATSDMQLLWNIASCLAHGERWYSTLTDGPREQVAEIVTRRSFDVVCSGINVTSLQILALAASNPSRGQRVGRQLAPTR